MIIDNERIVEIMLGEKKLLLTRFRIIPVIVY